MYVWEYSLHLNTGIAYPLRGPIRSVIHYVDLFIRLGRLPCVQFDVSPLVSGPLVTPHQGSRWHSTIAGRLYHPVD